MANESDPPHWVRKLSAVGAKYDYYVGQARNASSFRAGYGAALGIALHNIQSERSVTITGTDVLLSTMREENGAITSSTSQLVEKTKLATNGVIAGAKVHEIFVARHCTQTSELLDVYVLVGMKRRDRRQLPPAPTRGGALARSALLPGWGQAYQQRPKPAWRFAGVEAGLVAVGSFAALRASDDYSSAAASSQQQRRDHFQYRGDLFRWTSIATFAGALLTHGLNILDAGTAAPRVQYYE